MEKLVIIISIVGIIYIFSAHTAGLGGRYDKGGIYSIINFLILIICICLSIYDIGLNYICFSLIIIYLSALTILFIFVLMITIPNNINHQYVLAGSKKILDGKKQIFIRVSIIIIIFSIIIYIFKDNIYLHKIHFTLSDDIYKYYIGIIDAGKL